MIYYSSDCKCTRNELWHWLTAYRLGSHTLEEGDGPHVSGQAYIRNGIDGDQVVQAVGVRVEGGAQLFAERLVDGVRPVRRAQIQLGPSERILTQLGLDCSAHTSAHGNWFSEILI